MEMRPASMRRTGSEPTKPVPFVASVMAPYGGSPSRQASIVHLSFAPTDRPTVDRAVEAFRDVIEGRA